GRVHGCLLLSAAGGLLAAGSPFLARDHSRAGFAGERAPDIRGAGDQALLAPAVDIFAQRLNLRPHRALVELVFGIVAARLADAHSIEPALARRVEIDRHAVDPGREKEEIGADRPREQARGEILVDHGLDALELAGVVFDDRNAAAAAADDDEA